MFIEEKGVEVLLSQNEIKNTVSQGVFKKADGNRASVVMIVHVDNLMKINKTQYYLDSTQ